jgi:hypothetical protein
MRATLLALAVSILPSCATILSQSTYFVMFDTNPSGHEIAVTNQAGHVVYRGKTPTTIPLPASAGFFTAEHYTVTAEGFESGTIYPYLDGWYVGNILFGGLLGLLIVDPMTGAMWRLPDRYVISRPRGKQ